MKCSMVHAQKKLIALHWIKEWNNFLTETQKEIIQQTKVKNEN